MFDLFLRFVHAIAVGEKSDDGRAVPRTPYRVAMYVVGAIATFLFLFGFVALAPGAWEIGVLLVIVVIPILALLDVRARVDHGLDTPEAARARKESVRTWLLLLAMVAAVIVAVELLL